MFAYSFASQRSPDDLEENDARRQLPRFSEENFPNILKVVDSVKGLAGKHGVTSGQITLAWLLAQGDDILPIPGSTKAAVRFYFLFLLSYAHIIETHAEHQGEYGCAQRHIVSR